MSEGARAGRGGIHAAAESLCDSASTLCGGIHAALLFPPQAMLHLCAGARVRRQRFLTYFWISIATAATMMMPLTICCQ